MNVLVTGGCGFIGSALAEALVRRGDSVRVLDNLLTGSKERLPDGAELLEADLRDQAAVTAACSGVEVVFHQGALRSVPKSVDEPRLATECNVLGTLNVLIAAESAGVRRVVYASSSSVYGDGTEIQREEDMPDPRSPYAASKLAGEQYCRTWTHLASLPTVSLRYFNVFGPGQSLDSKYSMVFPAFISALLRGDAPDVHWDGEQAKDFTFIDDVVRANLLAADADADERTSGAVINIGGGSPKSVNQVLRAISDQVGIWIEPNRTPKRQGDVRRTHADITRARAMLGWEPDTEWDAGVAATVEWFSRTAAERPTA